MRTEEKWENGFKQSALKKFTPRIANDLQSLEQPKDLQGKPINSAFIHGKIQTGKTIRAAQMMLQELKQLYLAGDESDKYNSVLFASFPEMLAELKSTFNNPDKREEDVMKKYLDAHLLVLDDFLTTRPTGWVTDVLYYLINHRYEYLKKTIITSNFSLEELEEQLGDQRITSRIDRMCVVEQKQTVK